ncbi:MAG: hypothetical protein RIG62_16300 [Cyclobacteriaceae bacterium]|jgi:hypothetical protein
MISLLFKHWKFLLDALLIIALVVLLFLLNPFGLFGDGLSFGTTTNMVTEVRQIGQLVTAEYYGEVISSLDESRLALIEENDTQRRANQHYADLKQSLYDLFQYQQLPKADRTREYRENRDLYPATTRWRRVVQQEVSRRNIAEKLAFHSLLPEETELHQQVLEFLWREKLQHREDEDWNPNDRQAGEVLFALYTELAERHAQSSDAAFQNYLNDGFEFAANVNAFVLADQVSELSRTERKKKLAMVGRGWVKAGFDFSQLNEQTYYLDESTGELHFFGLEPQILNADINPWFIPERGIPGFDIINYQGAVDFRDAQRVKQHCIDKLLVYALQADIIGQAQRQGAETLKSFFSLLTGQEVTQVLFHNDILTQTARSIGQDEYLNYYEGLLVDSLLRHEQSLVDSLRSSPTNHSQNERLADERDSLQKIVLGRLRQLRFEEDSVPFHYYSVLAYRIGQDSIVDQHEQQELAQVRWDLTQSRKANIDKLSKYKSPRYWFEDSLALMMQYNAALDYLLARQVMVADTMRRKLPATEIGTWLDTAQVVLLDDQTVDDTTYLTYVPQRSIDTTFLLQLRYPFHYSPEVLRLVSQLNPWPGDSLPPPSDAPVNLTDTDILHTYDSLGQRLPAVRATFRYRGGIELLDRWTPGSASPPSLTDRQRAELLAYYHILKQAHEQQQRKGAIIRASEWVRHQFTHPSDSVSSLHRLKDFLFD